jgi:hypothetical protein
VALRQVAPQRVEHSDGWAVANGGRELVLYDEGDRVAVIGIGRGRPSSRLYADTLVWRAEDGSETPVAAPERAVVLSRIVEGLSAMSSSTFEVFGR